MDIAYTLVAVRGTLSRGHRLWVIPTYEHEFRVVLEFEEEPVVVFSELFYPAVTVVDVDLVQVPAGCAGRHVKPVAQEVSLR